LSSSVVAVIGIAGVVVVLVSVLSIGVGFKAAVQGTGSPNRAIVLRNGSQSEMTSGLTGPETDIVKQAPGIAQSGGRPVAAAEMFVVVDLPKRSTGTPANVPIRGIEAGSLSIRPELKIVDGRAPQLGTNEAMVGRAAQHQFAGVDLGATYTTGQLSLKIVGVFTTNGSSAESEIWCDSKVLQGAYRRGNSYQSVLIQLDSPASFDNLKNWLTTNPQLNVEAKREQEFYAGQTQVMTGLIDSIGYTISVLMALGAIFGAVLTMYTAVATRTREIATLRALGFNTTSVLVSVVGESLVLALIGGAAGAALAYIGFNGYETSTMNFSSFSQIAFAFHVTPALLTQGLIWALMIGFLGGLFPAIRAARLPISSALREL
jgi:putative ABC transport system permease protein